MIDTAHFAPERWFVLSGEIYDTIRADAGSPDGFLWLRLEAKLIELVSLEDVRSRIAQLAGSDVSTVHVVAESLDPDTIDTLQALASPEHDLQVHDWLDSPSRVLMSLAAPDRTLTEAIQSRGASAEQRSGEVHAATDTALLERYRTALTLWEIDARDEYGDDFDARYAPHPIEWDAFLPRSDQRRPGGLLEQLREPFELLWHTVTASARKLNARTLRFFPVPHLLATARGAWRPATRDAVRHAFVSWPAMGLLVMAVVFTPWVGKLGIQTYLWSMLGATLLSIAGAAVCGPVVSVLGVGAGGIFLALAFALVDAMLALLAGGVEGLASYAGATDPFPLVTYGVIGSVAPLLRQLPVGYTVAVLYLPGLAIAAAAWLMGEPSAGRPARELPLRSIVMWGAIGSFAGAAIPAVEGLTYLLGIAVGTPELAFCIAAALIGGTCYSLAVWLRGHDLYGAIRFGVAYGALGALLWTLTLALRGSLPGLYVAGMGTAFFHSCFFTLSYVLGLRFGGRHAAFLAATLEGVIGFVLFNGILIFQGGR